ncbi:resolvase [Devosia subaequoris]|uniref:resolvase n=1 Tax=Devosia subaequoris TaxID=395930 RepID=UPI00209F8D62|nr:resolvase [Devosia subaequoris]MCP1211262.1 resolvase [Devosia subaequoris]
MSWPWTSTKRKARQQVVGRSGDQRSNRPIRAETRARMLAGIAKARSWLDEVLAGRVKGTHEIAEREGCSERSARMTLNLAFLSPEVVKAVVDGSISNGMTVTQLTEAEMDWDEQSELLRCSWSPQR